jgi:hypothetical protein
MIHYIHNFLNLQFRGIYSTLTAVHNLETFLVHPNRRQVTPQGRTSFLTSSQQHPKWPGFVPARMPRYNKTYHKYLYTHLKNNKNLEGKNTGTVIQIRATKQTVPPWNIIINPTSSPSNINTEGKHIVTANRVASVNKTINCSGGTDILTTKQSFWYSRQQSLLNPHPDDGAHNAGPLPPHRRCATPPNWTTTTTSSRLQSVR